MLSYNIKELLVNRLTLFYIIIDILSLAFIEKSWTTLLLVLT